VKHREDRGTEETFFKDWQIAAANPMSWKQAEIRELKVNRYMVIDESRVASSVSRCRNRGSSEAKARSKRSACLMDRSGRSSIRMTHKVRVR